MATVYWFRHDLRLRDNPALTAAVKASNDVIPIYIWDSQQPRTLGGAQRWWLHHSLNALRQQLHERGLQLVLLHGDTQEQLQRLLKKYPISAIYWNRVYEPKLLQRDQRLQQKLTQQGIVVETFNASLLTEPEQIKNKSGTYFKVYTPYWRCVSQLIQPRKTLPIPRRWQQHTRPVSDNLDAWKLLPQQPDWSIHFPWQPGEQAAQAHLKRFLRQRLQHYSDNRDRPDVAGTSHLSPYLHTGELSPHQVWLAVKEAGVLEPVNSQGAEGYLRQLIWREFAYYLLWHFPDMPRKNFQAAFDHFAWQTNNKALSAWQKGVTGFPIVDAGMRELWQTGYMHNRVRMIVASFLTKDLMIHWREGERWFWDTLVDADLANNTMGWQWVAGSGPDAAPYFRIFNPWLQGKKFDPDCHYVKRWVPELAKLDARLIHKLGEVADSELAARGITLGVDYPRPIVEHKVARDKALASYQQLR